MSGGHFNYEQYKIGQIADQVEQLILKNGTSTTDEWGHTYCSDYSAETIAEFKKGLEFLKLAEVYVQRIDWLVSGDDGEETFHERLKSDLENKL